MTDFKNVYKLDNLYYNEYDYINLKNREVIETLDLIYNFKQKTETKNFKDIKINDYFIMLSNERPFTKTYEIYKVTRKTAKYIFFTSLKKQYFLKSAGTYSPDRVKDENNKLKDAKDCKWFQDGNSIEFFEWKNEEREKSKLHINKLFEINYFFEEKDLGYFLNQDLQDNLNY